MTLRLLFANAQGGMYAGCELSSLGAFIGAMSAYATLFHARSMVPAQHVLP